MALEGEKKSFDTYQTGNGYKSVNSQADCVWSEDIVIHWYPLLERSNNKNPLKSTVCDSLRCHKASFEQLREIGYNLTCQ